MAVVFICLVVMLFATVLVWESGRELRGRVLRPAGLFLWLIAGNWTAKLGGLLVSIGTGALLRYLMLNFDLPAHAKIMAGVAIVAVLGTTSAMLSVHSGRRAISLSLAGASLGGAYLTTRPTRIKCPADTFRSIPLSHEGLIALSASYWRVRSMQTS